MFSQIAPFIGYAASLFLIIALLVKTAINFRVYNIIGCSAFIVYGAVLSFWPVLITNVILLIINVYYLYKLFSHNETFDIITFNGDEKLIAKFIRFYEKDITTYFPNFKKDDLQGNFNFVVLRDLVIANIFSAKVEVDGTANIHINYTIKKYRDFKVGNFIFEKEKMFLINNGVNTIVYNVMKNKSHVTFLKTNGFVKDQNGWKKELATQ